MQIHVGKSSSVILSEIYPQCSFYVYKKLKLKNNDLDS